MPLGGQGCPEVAEFAVRSSPPRSAAPRSRGVATCLMRWRGSTGSRTAGPASRPVTSLRGGSSSSPSAPRRLSLQAAAFVDQHVAPVAHKIGPAQLERLIEEAKARFDPERTEAERLAAAEARRLDVLLAQVSTVRDRACRGRPRPGRCHRLRGRPRRRRPPAAAARLHRDPRRAPLHRGRQPRPQPAGPRPHRSADDQPRRSQSVQEVLHVHLEHSAVLGRAGWPGTRRSPARSPPNRSAVVRRPRHPGHGPAGPRPCRAPPRRLPTKPPLGSRLQTQLRDLHLRLPVLLRPAERCDCDHRVAHDHDRTTTDRPAPATSPRRAAATTARRPPAAGTTSPSNPASTCGEARWATSSSTTTPAPSMSPPMTNACASPRVPHPLRRHTRPRTLTTPPRTPLSTTRAGRVEARCRRHGRAAGRQRHDRRDVRSDRLRDDQSWAPRCGRAPGPDVVVGPVGRGNDAIADHDPGWACVVDGDAPGVERRARTLRPSTASDR